MIRLQQQCLEGLDTLPGLQQALQNAIELEHATLPPYLYALYSLDETKNSDICDLIRSVVLDEMSHFGFACNILNAIGGSPKIDDPSFIPTYPGPLPCGVEDQLTVPLEPFSNELVKSVFMVIEEPEDPLATDPEDPEGPTIGQFYDAIKAAIIAQGSTIFTGSPDLQLSHPHPVVTPVGSVDDAVNAIELIVEQGEGTTQSPDDETPGELAHYYRFGEIYHGKTLIANPNPPPGWVYEGTPIPFDSTGVLPVVTNPKAADYENTPAAEPNDQFNQIYSTMLQDLHTTFNGKPDNIHTAVRAMVTLASQAASVMQIELGDGQNAGPTFEYQTPAGR